MVRHTTSRGLGQTHTTSRGLGELPIDASIPGGGGGARSSTHASGALIKGRAGRRKGDAASCACNEAMGLVVGRSAGSGLRLTNFFSEDCCDIEGVVLEGPGSTGSTNHGTGRSCSGVEEIERLRSLLANACQCQKGGQPNDGDDDDGHDENDDDGPEENADNDDDSDTDTTDQDEVSEPDDVHAADVLGQFQVDVPTVNAPATVGQPGGEHNRDGDEEEAADADTEGEESSCRESAGLCC